MGFNSIDEFLGKAKRSTAPAEESGVARWYSGADEKAKLGAAVKKGMEKTPDTSARVLKLQMSTGLPADLVERNLDAVEREARRKDFDPEKFRSESPVVAGWLAENPDHFALAQDDFDSLGLIERLTRAVSTGYTHGRKTSELGRIGYEMAAGRRDPAMRERVAELERSLRRTPGGSGFASEWVYPAAKLVGQMVDSGTRALERGVEGALAGGTAAAIAGQLGPQVALPEEIITVPGTALAGFGAGLTAGFAEDMYRVEAGHAYLELSDIRGENGEQIPETTKRGAAVLVGLLNAALETTGVSLVAAPFKAAGKKFISGSVKEALKGATMRTAMANFAKSYAGAVVGETATEVMQEGVNVLAEEAAKLATEGDFETLMNDPEQRSAAVERLVSIASETFRGMALVGLPGATVNLASDVNQVKRAELNRAFFEELGKTAEGSKTRKRLPEKFEEVVERLTKDGPVDTVYVPVEAWNTYWQEQNTDPRDIAGEVLGDTKTYDEAALSGEAIAIPMGRYARKLAPTEHNTFFVDEMRLDPLGMSAREAREFIEFLKEMETAYESEAALAEDPSDRVVENVAGQLMAAGVEESTARAQGELWGAFFRTLGERAGIDPAEMLDWYNVNIQRGELPAPEAAPKDKGMAEAAPEGEASVNASSEAEAGRTRRPRRPKGKGFNPDYDSLADFVRQQGGISTEEEFLKGEVKDRFSIREGYNLVNNKTGRTLDDLAGAATEQGFFSERPTVGEFLDLLRNDVDAKAAGKEGAVWSMARQEYWQGKGQGSKDPRGRITFGLEGVNIDLLPNADLSTFLHETGHFYLKVLGDMAKAEGFPQDIKADYQTILGWLGVESTEQLKAEHHEQFARGFEAYLMEGKAPSEALRSSFARFRAWLISVYRKLARLDVKLTPEVREVMDRLLATEEEIEAAQAQQGMFPLFADPEMVGMSKEEAVKYSKAISEAKQAAEDELLDKLLAQVGREIKKWWKDEREKVYAEVAEEVNSRPVYRVLEVLQKNRGQLAEDENPIKLSKKAIVEQWGEERLKGLPRPYVYTVEGGLHPDEVAGMFGFSSGDEMLTAMENAENKKALIDHLTDTRMKALHGDPFTDGSLPAQAMKAVHTDKRAQLLRKELEYLAQQNFPAFKGMVRRVARRVPTVEAIRAHAERTIARKPVRKINPYLHQRAEAKAAKAAVNAFLKGDIDKAFHSKLQELISHELYRAANEAREKIDGIVKYMKRFEKKSVREKLGKAGADYLDQIDALLDRYEFRKVPYKDLQRRRSLMAWAKEQEDQGLSVNVPEELLAESRRVNYREATFEELLGVEDTVKNIEHLARLKNRLLANKRRRNFEDAVDDIVTTVEAHHKMKADPDDFAPDFKDRLITRVKEGVAAHTKMEFLFEFLDGNKAGGAVWEHLFKPFAEADNEKSRMNREVSVAMKDIFSAYSRAERAGWFLKRTYIPAIGKSLNKANMLVVALNQGNTYNRQALMDGYGWTADQVEAILDKLDERDWKTVQAVWDYIDTFYPEIAQIEKEISGLAPEKVQADPVQTKFGTFRGGYYPIIFDSNRSHRQTQLSEAEQVREMFGGKWGRAMTKHGHTIERRNTGGKPLLLELSGLTEHLENVVHDIAYRRAIIDVWRLANNEEVRWAITRAAGRDMYKQIAPWIRAIAADRRRESFTVGEGLLARARHGATIVNMGWKLTTALVQFLGYSVSIKELGAKYAALGLKDAYKRPDKLAETYNFIAERSEFMRERPRNYDRDVRDTLRGMGVMGKQGILSAADTYTVGVRSTWFALVAYMDMAVSVPTWLGAYRKAMDGKLENIEAGDEKAAVEFADRTVRVSQSAGQVKDLAAVQRGTENWKLFTMFYSYFSLLANQFGKTYAQFRLDKNVPKLMASLFLLWFAPAVLEDLLLGRGPDDDDDDEAWLKWAAKKEAMYPFQSVVLLRDVVNGMDRWGYEPSAAFDMFESASRAGKLGVNLATGEEEEIKRSDIRNAVMLVGYFAHLPSRQLWLTGEYFHDWMVGEIEPETVPEGVWRGLVSGKKRD